MSAKVIYKKIYSKTDYIIADILKRKRQSRVYYQKRDIIATALSFTKQRNKTVVARIRPA
jgi:hypothetical protein